MSSSHFEKLRDQTKKLDEGIFKLTETWKLPSVLVGGYAECCEETIAFTEAIRTSLQNAQDDIGRRLEDKEAPSDDEDDFEVILQKSEAAYKDLRSQCDDLDIVLQEYGYHYVDNNISSCNAKVLEVEFTPELSWKCKGKLDRQLMPIGVSRLQKSEASVTPINKTLASVLAMSTPTKDESKGTFTPGRDRPQEPIYSTHFYNVSKKL